MGFEHFPSSTSTSDHSGYVDSWLELSVNQFSSALVDMSVVYNIDRFLRRSQQDPHRYKKYHVQQPIVVVWRVVALEQLCPDHQSTNGTHHPRGNSDTALA